jgi:small-conductance mechanosensitive channel
MNLIESQIGMMKIENMLLEISRLCKNVTDLFALVFALLLLLSTLLVVAACPSFFTLLLLSAILGRIVVVLLKIEMRSEGLKNAHEGDLPSEDRRPSLRSFLAGRRLRPPPQLQRDYM